MRIEEGRCSKRIDRDLSGLRQFNDRFPSGRFRRELDAAVAASDFACESRLGQVRLADWPGRRFDGRI